MPDVAHYSPPMTLILLLLVRDGHAAPMIGNFTPGSTTSVGMDFGLKSPSDLAGGFWWRADLRNAWPISGTDINLVASTGAFFSPQQQSHDELSALSAFGGSASVGLQWMPPTGSWRMDPSIAMGGIVGKSLYLTDGALLQETFFAPSISMGVIWGPLVEIWHVRTEAYMLPVPGQIVFGGSLGLDIDLTSEH